MKKLESLLMVRGQVILRTLVGTEMVNTRLKTSKHLLNRLFRLLRKILILTPVSLKQPSLHRSYPLMVLCRETQEGEEVNWVTKHSLKPRAQTLIASI